MIKVFILDDEAVYVKMVKLALEAEGAFEVFTETDPRRGVEGVLACQPDVIILDIIMPYLSGIDLAQEIRRIPSHENTPIIFLTASYPAKSKPPKIVRSSESLPKPVGVEELARHIRGVVASSSKAEVPEISGIKAIPKPVGAEELAAHLRQAVSDSE